MPYYYKSNKSRLNAISRSYANKREEQAKDLYNKARAKGLNVKKSKYAQITINRCNDALKKSK